MKYVPNVLTTIRLLLVPVFIRVYFSSVPNHRLWALSIFLFAGLTDILDGYIARKYNAVTKIGTAIDPLADKLMLLAALGSLFLDNRLSGFIFSLMAFEESALMAIGSYLHFAEGFSVIPANRFGKSATLAFTLAVVLLFLFPSSIFTLLTVLSATGLKTMAFFIYLKETLRMWKDNK